MTTQPATTERCAFCERPISHTKRGWKDATGDKEYYCDKSPIGPHWPRTQPQAPVVPQTADPGAKYLYRHHLINAAAEMDEAHAAAKQLSQ